MFVHALILNVKNVHARKVVNVNVVLRDGTFEKEQKSMHPNGIKAGYRRRAEEQGGVGGI